MLLVNDGGVRHPFLGTPADDSFSQQTPHLHDAVHKFVTLSCVFILMQLNKCVVLCVVLFCKVAIVVMGDCLRRFCLNMKIWWHIRLLRVDSVRWVALGGGVVLLRNDVR